jgi:hypothetical protein
VASDAPSTDVAAPARVPTKLDVTVVGLLFVGVLFFAVGTVLAADLLVATTTRSAEVTDLDRTTRRKDGVTRTSYTIRGEDAEGGRFAIGADSRAFARASVGDDVEIERSVLTGRVVRVEGDGWRVERSGLVLGIAAAVAVAGALTTAGTSRSIRRDLRAASAAGAPIAGASRLLSLVLGGAVAVVVIWLLVERVRAG